MDVGFLNGRLFLNVAGVGFDAAVGHAFHESGRKGGRRGLFGYVRLSLAELRSYRPPRLAIEVLAERLDLVAFVVTFANGPQYGAGALINPGRSWTAGGWRSSCSGRAALEDAPRRAATVPRRARARTGLQAPREIASSPRSMPRFTATATPPATERISVELRPRPSTSWSPLRRLDPDRHSRPSKRPRRAEVERWGGTG
jgi:hypothetical protein